MPRRSTYVDCLICLNSVEAKRGERTGARMEVIDMSYYPWGISNWGRMSSRVPPDRETVGRRDILPMSNGMAWKLRKGLLVNLGGCYSVLRCREVAGTMISVRYCIKQSTMNSRYAIRVCVNVNEIGSISLSSSLSCAYPAEFQASSHT